MDEAIGRNRVFPIYNADGTSFHDLILRKPTFDSVVMSLGDKITGDVYYKDANLQCSMKEYVDYQGVHFQLVNPPTIVKEGMASDNSDLKGLTRYSFEFYHPMYVLSNLPFTDIAVSSDEQRYLSQNKTFYWIGYLVDFVAKLNKNLEYTQWICDINSTISSDKLQKLSEVLSFDNNTIADALKTAYETWAAPFVIDVIPETDSRYEDGKRFVVIFGLPSNEIYESDAARREGTPYVFEYGQGVGLKNNSATPKNNKIITRIAGYGSEDNIPYGYPQIVWEGNDDDPMLRYPLYDGIVGGRVVKLIKHPFTRNHLMPSIYSETVNKKVNPRAQGYNPSIEIKDYYDADDANIYPHTINMEAPSYEIHQFEGIKPEFGVEHIIYAHPINDDTTDASEWIDDIDDNGNYLQSYFKIQLPVLDFDIYACAAITQEMKINMRSGACLGCTFDVQVDWEDYKRNFYDSEGNFAPDGEQRDLARYPNSSTKSIEIIVQKDINTFGTMLPNIYQQPQGGDQFVILGISMPISYITNAEQRLDEAMKEYMLENNVYYFEYPLKVDEYFLATHTYILSQIKNNTIFRFRFQGQVIPLYVKQITIKYGDKPLPEYSITLTDDVEIVLSKIGQVTEDVSRMRVQVSALQAYFDKGIYTEINNKLSRVQDDTAQGLITFKKGLKVGNFRSRFFGSGAIIDREGNAEFESIYSRSFISTPEFRFNRIAVTEGEQWCTNGYGTIKEVEVIDETHGKVTLQLEENDFASIAAGDICRGIYNDIANEYTTASLDDDSSLYAGENEGAGFGFSSKVGFFTSYFWITRFEKNEKGTCVFYYELRNTKTPHPCAFMKFAQYGSFTNSSRRSSSYATSIGHYYEMVLDGVSTWKIQSANVVYRKGYLGDMTVTLRDGREVELRGYGLYVQDNVYFGNAIIQLDPQTLDDIDKMLANYIVSFSEHIEVVTVDDVGNAIGGLWVQDGNYRRYRIQSAISVRRNNTILTVAEAGEDAGEGTYKIYAQPTNCSCIVEDSTLYITGINNIKDGVAGSSDDVNFDYNAMRLMDKCWVDIIIDCEGKGSIQKEFPIRIKHDSQPYVGADITNEFSAVSWNTRTNSYIGLPIVFDMKMWHNNEPLDIASTSDVSISTDTNGINVSKSIVTIGGQKVARLSITSLPSNLPLVTELDVTCSATYAGVRYERTLTHTINKSTDTNVYSLLPSVSDVIVDKKTGAISVNTITCDVFCDSSNDEHYNVAYSELPSHHIVVYYKIFYVDGTSGNEVKLTQTPISVNGSMREVRFYLYGLNGNTVDRNNLHDSEGVPIIANGVDGNGVEFIFFRQNVEKPLPTIYDENSQSDNYCPYTDEYHTAQWTDEPSGVGVNARYEFYAQRKMINGQWGYFGDVRLWNRYAEDGESPYIIDLSNEQSFVNCDEDGNVIGSYESSELFIFKGTEYAYDDFRILVTPTNITCNGYDSTFELSDTFFDSYTLTPSNITSDTAQISITATHKTNSSFVLVATYSVNKNYAGGVGVDALSYSLLPSLNVVHKDKNNNFTETTINIEVKKVKGESTTILSTIQSLNAESLILKYSRGENSEQIRLTSLSNNISTLFASGAYITLFLYNTANTLLDKERINVVKDGDDGEKGDDGDPAVLYYLTSDVNTITKDASGNFIGDSTPFIKAWKKVGDKDAVALSTITHPVRADGMTIQVIHKSGNINWWDEESSDGEITCSTPAQEVTSIYAELGENLNTSAKKVYHSITIPILTEVQGADGADGVFPRDCGLFDQEIATKQTYGYAGYIYRKVGNIVIRDKVSYEIGGVMYGFLVKTLSSTALVTTAPTNASGDDNWEAVGIIQTVIANTFFSRNANIGGFMASLQQLRSSTPAYRTFYAGIFVKATGALIYRGDFVLGKTYDIPYIDGNVYVLTVVRYNNLYYKMRTNSAPVATKYPTEDTEHWETFNSEGQPGGNCIYHQGVIWGIPDGIGSNDNSNYEYTNPTNGTPPSRPIVYYNGEYHTLKGKFLGSSVCTFTNPASSLDWRLAREDEIVTTSGDTADVHKFALFGETGTLIMRQADDTVFTWDETGRQINGIEYGQKVVLEPSTKSIAVYDDSNRQAITINGDRRSDISSIRGNTGSYALSPRTGSQTINATTSTSKVGVQIINVTTGSFELELPSMVTITGTISAQGDYRTSEVWCPDKDKGTLSYIQPIDLGNGNYGHQSYCFVELIVIDAAGVIKTISSVKQGKNGTVSTKNISTSFTLSSGKYKLALRVTYAIYSKSSNTSNDGFVIASYENIGGSWSNKSYMGEVFANGLAFGSSGNNIFGVVHKSQTELQLKAISNGQYGFEVANDGLYIWLNGTRYKVGFSGGNATLTVSNS